MYVFDNDLIVNTLIIGNFGAGFVTRVHGDNKIPQYRTKDCKRLPGKGFMRITTFQA
jgi:hypothetical protein